MRRSSLTRLILPLLLFAAPGVSADDFHQLRAGAIDSTPPAPPMQRYEELVERRVRSYPEQPPTIPHAIDNYEISLRVNQCLSCHSRHRSAETGAPMVSISHFMGRDMQVLSDVSARRYACTQCHVAQTAATPPVGSDFIDAADLTQ